MLNVRVVTDVEEFSKLQSAWDSLLDPGDPRSIYLSHEWFSIWREAFAPEAPLHVVVAERGGTLVAALPLYESMDRDRGIPIRRLRLMANGHSPHADLVCRDTEAPAALMAITDFLRRDALSWDSLVLPEIAQHSRLHRHACGSPSNALAIQALRSSPYIPLAGGWETYKKELSKRFLKVLRNNVNRVRKHGSCEIECFTHPVDVDDHLEVMFRIGERSWQGEENSAVGSTPGNRHFYRSLALAFASRGQLRLWFLKLDGVHVAFEFHLLHAGVEFGLKTGYDRDFEKLGVGTYLDQHIVLRLFEDPGLEEYDLLGNFDFYKQRWTRHTRDYHRIWMYGDRWRARWLSLVNLRLIPILKEQDDVLGLRSGWASLRLARQGNS